MTETPLTESVHQRHRDADAMEGETLMPRPSLIDRLTCHAGIWSLRRLFGECPTDVAADFPGEGLDCPGCDVRRMVARLRDVLEDRV